MSAIEEVSSLNNQGIDSLTNRNNNAAIGAFSKALSILKKELSQKTKTLALHQSEIQAVLVPVLGSADGTDFDDCNQAIHIQMTSAGLMSELGIQIFSAASVFNMALSLHRASIQEGKAANAAKAILLYKTVLKLLDEYALQFRAAIMIKLTAHKNLVLLQCEQCSHVDTARQDMDQLISLSRAANAQIIAEPQFQAMLMKLILMLSTKHCASAA